MLIQRKYEQFDCYVKYKILLFITIKK